MLKDGDFKNILIFQLSLLRKYHHDINMYIIKFQEILSVLLHRQGCYIHNIYSNETLSISEMQQQTYLLSYIYRYTHVHKKQVSSSLSGVEPFWISSPCPLPRSRGLPCLPWRVWRLASDWEHGMPYAWDAAR